MLQALATSLESGTGPDTGLGAGTGAPDTTELTGPGTAELTAPGTAELSGWLTRLAAVDGDAPDGVLIDQIGVLERMKSACAAAQAVLTAAFVTSRTAGVTGTTRKEERVRASVTAQVALARRVSPTRGGQHVGLATALVMEMPHTMAALRSGDITEWRATLITRATACLTTEHRQVVDGELAGRLTGMGDRRIAEAATGIAQRLDPAAWVARNRKAVGGRRVSIRPAPDTMSYLTAVLPVAQGVAVYAALNAHAGTARAGGDHRSRGQLMADELVHRITTPHLATSTTDTPDCTSGSAAPDPAAPDPAAPDPAAPDPAAPDPATAEAVALGTAAPDPSATGGAPAAAAPPNPDPDGIPPGVNVEIQLVMTDRTLLDGDEEPAILTGYGPIPAALARRLIRGADPGTTTWVRRLFTDPVTGHLATADTRRRIFTPAARHYLIARDQYCRTPYCGAPIRHADHTTPHARGGPTSISNGQGLCENCNYTKQAPGWNHQATGDGVGILITTPTGHTTRSDPPPPPRSAPWVAATERSGYPTRPDLSQSA